MSNYYETTTIEVLFLGQGDKTVKFIPSPIDITRRVDLDADYGSGTVIEVPTIKRHYVTSDEWEIAEIEKSIHYKTGAIMKKVKTHKSKAELLSGMKRPQLMKVASESINAMPDQKPVNSWTTEELITFILENDLEIRED